MRKAFFAALHDLMFRDGRVWFLTGDLGHGLVEPLFTSFPDRAINCGVIEPTMIGIAAGLARAGKIPFVYSIAPFLVTRCAEQWKLDVVAPKLKVIGVGVGQRMSYRNAGPSHWDIEIEKLADAIGLRRWPADLAILTAYGQTIGTILREAIEQPGPMLVTMP